MHKPTPLLEAQTTKMASAAKAMLSLKPLSLDFLELVRDANKTRKADEQPK